MLTGGALVLSDATFSHQSASTPIFLENLHCGGDETMILQCDRFSDIGIHTCSHSEDVGIICYCKRCIL